MLQSSFSLRQFRVTKWSFFVHSTTRNAPNVQPRLDSILELCRTFPIEVIHVHLIFRYKLRIQSTMKLCSMVLLFLMFVLAQPVWGGTTACQRRIALLNRRIEWLYHINRELKYALKQTKPTG